jgi:hypothetical protein
MIPRTRRGSAGEPHARDGLLASQHAIQRGPAEDPEKSQEPKSNQQNASITPEQVAKDLKAIIKGLEEEGVESSWIAAARRLATCVERTAKEKKPKQTIELVSERLSSIEKILMARQPGPPVANRGTWAAVAASGVRQIGEPKAANLNRHTVRITMTKAEEMSNQEILKEVKKTIPGAAAIRKLHSGDIDVTVPDVATKDRAQGILSTDSIKIHKKDYLVEVTGVPINLQVADGPQANNSELATEICEASKSLTPGLKITRVRWLYDQARLSRMRKEGKTHGSLLVGFPTQEMQKKAVQGGLVIQAQLHDARLFEMAMIEVQCFRCYGWGHTQAVCKKKARCGRCAGPHQTNNCPQESVSCINCGKKHRAWQRWECRSYQNYHDIVQQRRVNMLAATTKMRAACETAARSTPQQEESWVKVNSKKRAREASPRDDSIQRRVGRPTNMDKAARDPTQQRLILTRTPQDEDPQDEVIMESDHE